MKFMNHLLNREITETEGRKTFYTVICFVENTEKDCPHLSNGTFISRKITIYGYI